MKHLLTAALIVSATVAATAQQRDTTATQQQPRTRSQQEQQGQPGNQFNAKDYTQLQATEVTGPLRTTLQGDEYKGWEKGKVYRSKTGDGFYLTTGTGNTAKNYYFGKDGKALQSPEGGTNPRKDN